MSRLDNIEIFQDTLKLCEEDRELSEAIRMSNENQEFCPEFENIPEASAIRYDAPAKIFVSEKRTLEAARSYVGEKVCVLNFASAKNPGGGVTRGSSAQEEAICRCSTLYGNLTEEKMWNQFYRAHQRQHNPLYNDDCIYTPGVVVFKSDTAKPKLLHHDQWYRVNVLTCAAPNLRKKTSDRMNPGNGQTAETIGTVGLQQLHEKRMRKVLRIAAEKGNGVIILGAFGCGAFANPPEVVASAMKNVVQEFRYQFKTIEFAVYCSPRDDSNYQVFRRVFEKKKTLNDYMAMPYRMKIIEDQDEGGFVVSYPDLPGCITCGETEERAIANALDAKKAWLEAALEDGVEIYEPDSLDD